MQKILKIKISKSINYIRIPKGSILLSIKLINRSVYLIFVGNPNFEYIERIIFMFPSGRSFSGVSQYIGSVKVNNSYIHVLEK